MYERPEYVWLVYDLCDCEDDYCTSQTNISVFRNEQIAKQEADKRSTRYGGREPYMHIEKVEVSTKTSTH